MNLTIFNDCEHCKQSDVKKIKDLDVYKSTMRVLFKSSKEKD